MKKKRKHFSKSYGTGLLLASKWMVKNKFCQKLSVLTKINSFFEKQKKVKIFRVISYLDVVTKLMWELLSVGPILWLVKNKLGSRKQDFISWKPLFF